MWVIYRKLGGYTACGIPLVRSANGNGNGILLNGIPFNGITFLFPFADRTNGIPQAM